MAFSITGPKGRLHLRAQSVAEKQQWIDVFKVVFLICLIDWKLTFNKNVYQTALAFRGAAEKAKVGQFVFFSKPSIFFLKEKTKYESSEF